MRNTLYILFSVFTISAFAQVGVNTDTPTSAAVLHLEALNPGTIVYGGFLLPRVTESQQASIPVNTTNDVDDGLQVFVSDPITGKQCWEVYDSFAQVWRTISCLNTTTTPACGSLTNVLYEEDFESYAVDTGITGATASSGDYASVTKWSLSSYTSVGDGNTAYPGTLANADDYGLVKAVAGGQALEIQDANGPFRFQTEAINITGLADIMIQMDIREEGTQEYFSAQHTDDFNCGQESFGSDYVDIEYSTDGGSTFTEVPNYAGLGNGDHTLHDNLSSEVNFAINGITGTSLIIRIRLQNWAGGEQYYIDNILVTCN